VRARGPARVGLCLALWLAALAPAAADPASPEAPAPAAKAAPVRRAAEVLYRLRADEARLRAAGASDEELRALRVERLGAEGADRLDAIEQESARFDARVAAWREARDALLASPDAPTDPAARTQAVDALRAEYFLGSELLRVKRMDSIAARGGAPGGPGSAPLVAEPVAPGSAGSTP